MYSLLIMGVLLLFWGCDGTSTQEDEFPIRDVQFDYVQEQNKLYFAAYFKPAYQGGRLDSVQVAWLGTDSTSTPDMLDLNDLGQAGDIIADDDVWGLKVPNNTSFLSNMISITDTGMVFVEYSGYYHQETISVLDSYQLGNLKPTIMNVDIPDTMVRPSVPGYYSVDTIKVEVFDANGINDIQTCYLMFQKPDSSFANNGQPILFYDDGKVDQLLFLWDKQAGDGIYSRLITIGYNNPLGTYSAEFYTKDFANLYADMVVKTLVVVE